MTHARAFPKPPFPGALTSDDGTGAVVWVETHISQAACAYPITPSANMGGQFAQAAANGARNLWGEPLRFLQAESEHSSASMAEGFALAGGRVTNFTSGQGLILMKEVLYVISGKRLPVVFNIGARALTSQALNVHAGHDDVMGVADTGWGILFARNAQEAADLCLIARRAAEASKTPFLNVQDGFLTTHTVETLRLPEPGLMREFIGPPQRRLRPIFDPARGIMSGPVQNQEAYMRGKIAQRYYYDQLSRALEVAMEEYYGLTGRHYGLVSGYRMADADYAIVALGSTAETAEAVVDFLRERRGLAVGVVHPCVFRPFPGPQLVEMLKNTRAVAVIERMDNPAAQSNPLTAELKAAFCDALGGHPGYPKVHRIPEVFSGVAGLGSRDVRPADLIAVADLLAGENPARRRFFSLNIDHPSALPTEAAPDVRPPGAFSMRGYSIGGYGSVTTNKVIATVAAELFGVHVQAYPYYGSEKKGLPTNYYLTLAAEPIRTHCEMEQAEFVPLNNLNALYLGNPFAGLSERGIAFVQWASDDPESLWARFPLAARRSLREAHARVFFLDAARIAREETPRPELEIRMQGIVLLGVFLRCAPFRDRLQLADEALLERTEQVLRRYFDTLSEAVVAANLRCAMRGFNEVRELPQTLIAASAGEEAQRYAGPTEGDVMRQGVITCHADEALEKVVQTTKVAHQPLSTHGPRWAFTEFEMDLDDYADQFNEQVIGAYSGGKGGGLPADGGVARSLIPPATGMFRDFSHVSTELPRFIAINCVACMECVTTCPDTAILAKVAEPGQVAEQARAIGDKAERADFRDQWVATRKFHGLPEKRGETGGLFAIYVDPAKCKGCGECVEVCASHRALEMISKDDATVETYRARTRHMRALPETLPRFLAKRLPVDVMLREERTLLYVGGAGSCPGCGEATAIRMMLAATGEQFDREEIGIVAATGCNTVFGSTYPHNPFRVTWSNSLFENAPAVAMGVRTRWEQQGCARKRLWVIGGDGAMYDIGFQALSRLLVSRMDIQVLVLDTQVYSNTGGQASMATPSAAAAKMAPHGSAVPGKVERRKELANIAMMHPEVYVAQTSTAHVNHFYQAIRDANEFNGPALVNVYTTCQPEHGVADDLSQAQAKRAVSSRAFPLFVYDPRKGQRMRDRLSLRGNPALTEDWPSDPGTKAPYTFVEFARSEGRFARQFAPNGEPSAALLAAQADRLANWHLLRELAGMER